MHNTTSLNDIESLLKEERLENENLIRSFVHSEIEVENELLILEALPKYVIISKEGEILLNSNQKPSTEAFKEKLETYLQL